ncbi:MAG: dehydratase, partial [Sphingomonadales bacterium]
NAFLPQLIDVRGYSAGVNAGADRLRFMAPVPVGSRIRGRGEIVRVEERGESIHSVVRITVEIEGGEKPACVVDTISRYFR